MTNGDRYPIPSASARAEILVVNSHFIGSAAYTPSVNEAKDCIALVRAEFSDASHHPYAYLVGYGASATAGMSDAGEPSGTAGRPMLAVLRGSGLGDVTVVVTRYFGGTLLGTGGLVRAYSNATRAVLDVLQRAERVEKRTLHIQVDYATYDAVRRVLTTCNADTIDETFSANVRITAALPTTEIDACVDALSEVTAGQVEVITAEA